jgi:hypothetical protein
VYAPKAIEESHAWFVVDVFVQLKSNDIQAVIKEIDGRSAVVETEDTTQLLSMCSEKNS